MGKPTPSTCRTTNGRTSNAALEQRRSLPIRFDPETEWLAVGDPVDLAIRRTTTFRGRRKIDLVSTPALNDHSRIEAPCLGSDRRYFHVPCLQCGDMAPITWERIRWSEGPRNAACLVCDTCGGVHDEHEKPRLLAAGEWRPADLGNGRTAGFHL